MSKLYIKRITTRYYQLLDYVQRKWERFRKTEVGESLIWLVPRLLRWSWVFLKWSMAFMAAFIIFTYGLVIFMVLVCTGNGKAATNSLTKITLVVVGFFTAKHLVTHKAEVAKAIEAVITKP